MPKVPIIMPQLGESIAEATIVNISIAVGDKVESDQNVIEVETNKATMSVTTPCRGVVSEISAEVSESYAVGAVLGRIEVSEEEARHLGLNLTPAVSEESREEIEAKSKQPVAGKEKVPAKKSTVQPTVRGLPVPASAAGASYLSPRMKARMAELGLHAADLAGVAGSGAGGRVTIEDFEKFLSALEKHEIVPASTMRVAVADAMRRSWTRPLATVALPVSPTGLGGPARAR